MMGAGCLVNTLSQECDGLKEIPAGSQKHMIKPHPPTLENTKLCKHQNYPDFFKTENKKMLKSKA